MGHQHISHLKAARTRTAGGIQLAFALLSLVVSFPLIFTTTSKGPLSIAVIVASLVAGLLGIISSRLVLVFVSRRNWPRGINLRRFEHAWGISVGAHCVCLVATGLHVYFAVEVIYDCTENKPASGDFRPNCDANIGVLAGILPHLFGALALAMLGISSVIAAIRVATLVEQLTHLSASKPLFPINAQGADGEVGRAGIGGVGQRVKSQKLCSLETAPGSFPIFSLCR